MRDDPVDVVVGEVVAAHHLQHVVAHVGHGIAEHGASLLIEVVQTVVHREVAGRTDASTGLHVKEGKTLAVGAQERVLIAYALLLGSLQQHGSGSIAEEHAGLAVGVVDERRHLVSTDDDDLLVAAALNHRRSNVERVEESAASSLKVEGEGVFQPELAQHDAGRGGELVVWGCSGYNQGIDGVGGHTRLVEELARGLAGHVARAKAFLGEDTALLDAYTRRNPLVTGVYHAREFLIGEDIVGHVTSNTSNYRVDLSHYSAASFSTATIPR